MAALNTHNYHPYVRHFSKDDVRLYKMSQEIPSISHTSNGDVIFKRKRDQLDDIYQYHGKTALYRGPYFDSSLPRNLTVQTGKTAVLSCKVINSEEKTVSWIRLHDLHILTVDKYKYSTDQRVSVIFNEANKEWVLRILAAKHSDMGKYECQVSTKPVLSYIVSLNVVVPQARIINSPDIYVHRGSLINLTCVVSHGTDQPVFIYWHHYNQLVNIEVKRRNVEVTTNQDGETLSHLLVRGASFDDSGKYTCKPSNGEDASVTLHILTGELQQAAMQTNTGTSIGRNSLIVPIFIVLSVCERISKCVNYSE